MQKFYEEMLKCQITNINPTIIYNEGWMTRILVEYSVEYGISINELNFGDINNWTSEGSLSSPFLKTKIKKERHTRTDIAFGDFDINYEERSEIMVKNGKIFGVIEAKMGSKLSKGTTNAKNYNQASRNAVCIANNIIDFNCESFFILVAPKSKVKQRKLNMHIEKSNILDQVKNRFKGYDNAFLQNHNYLKIIKKIENMKIFIVTYEEWIEKFSNHTELKQDLQEFYNKCKKWNNVK